MELLILIFIIYVLYSIFKKKDKKADFSLYSPYQENTEKGSFHPNSYNPIPISHNKTKGRWIASNEEVQVGNKVIQNGFFYLGGVLKGQYQVQTESSLVDDTLPIKAAEYTFEDGSLNYWPMFYTLSPMCRGAYIDWLASDRNMTDVPIGYLFIYFYGLERRIIKDYQEGNVDDKELKQITNEVIRLRSVFKHNRSFSGYSLNLLEFVSMTSPKIYSLPDEKIYNSIQSDVFKLKLANTVNNNEPLNSKLAFAWISNHPDYNLRTPSRRCLKEFKSLFIQKYKDKYKEGIRIKRNKTKLRFRYHPASSSLESFEYGTSGLCDPSVLSAPVKKLAAIALECTDELDAYSRYLGKQDTSKEDIDALLLLPDPLITEYNIPFIEDFKSWASHIIVSNDGISNFEELWKQTKLPLPSKLNKKEQSLICNLIKKSGYAFAPHPNLHGNNMKIDGPVVIYKQDNTVKFKKSVIFDDVVIKLRLGSIIANADLKIHSNEVSFLTDIINSNENLSYQEKLSLKAYLKWLLNSPSNFIGLKASMGKLLDKDHEVVRKMLINVALSDGTIDPSEVKEIEKLYTKLGLDKSKVPADIHALSSRKDGLSRSTIKTTKLNEKEVFELDESILRTHETETQAAQDILNKIFKDEESIEDLIVRKEEQTLENKSLSIYKLISHREKIDRAEFEKICTQHGFFVDAAIDSINEWAFEHVNAPVIEEDTDILIDGEIANELAEIEGE
jgi:uncharacterized tellurite resistance protein B-like protein